MLTDSRLSTTLAFSGLNAMRSRLLSIIVAAGTLMMPAPGSAQTLLPLRVGVSVPDPVNMLLYIADAKGFFQSAGIQVQLVQFQGGGPAAQALTAGAVDVNESAIFEVMDSFATGRDLTAVWSVSLLPAYTWYGLPKYKSIADLKGTGKIAVSSLSSMTYSLARWAVAGAGLNPDRDVAYVPMGGPLERVAALRAKQVDAVPATPPGTFLLQQEGFSPLFELRTVLPEFQYEVLYERRTRINELTAATRDLIRATLHAKSWAMANPDQATGILLKNLGGRDEDRAIYRKTLDVFLPAFPDDGHYSEKSIALFLQFYREQGRFKTLPQLSDLIDSRIADGIRNGH